MENDNSQPLLVAGMIPEKCYTSINEFVTELSKVLRIPTDTIAVIKGAQGEPGKTGPKGDKGAQGENGKPVTAYNKIVDLISGTKYTSFPVFTGWRYAIYSIVYNGDTTGYDPTTQGNVGVGALVPQEPVVPGDPPETIRLYFLFDSMLDSIPDSNFQLYISYISPV